MDLWYSEFHADTIKFSIQIEKQFEETKEMLTIEMDFDLDKFMEQNESESKNYLSSLVLLTP